MTQTVTVPEPVETRERTAPPTLRQLLMGFGYLSVVSVGGGTAAWARELFVLRDHWMTDDQYLEARALSQILPGPNMLNFAVYVGTHFHGAVGGAVAFAGLTTIPVILIMVLGILYMHSGVVPSAAAVLTGLAAAAAGASFGTGFSSGKKHFKEPVFTLLTAVVYIAVGVLKYSMLWVALLVTAVAIGIYRPRPAPAPGATSRDEG